MEQMVVRAKRNPEKSQVQVIARAASILRALEDQSAGLSLGQIALRTAAARTSMMLTGGPEDVADRLQTWFEAGAADGFVVAPPALPVMLERFVETVVPILQARGVFREHYEGPTLRDHLGLERPISRYETDPGLHREPEIWQPK